MAYFTMFSLNSSAEIGQLQKPVKIVINTAKIQTYYVLNVSLEQCIYTKIYLQSVIICLINLPVSLLHVNTVTYSISATAVA
jgi:hypothetical protein